MKLSVISDIHEKWHELTIPESDVLIICGDMFNDKGKTLMDFLTWLRDQPCRFKLFIGGNHDFTLEGMKPRHYGDGIYYLADSEISIDGVKFYGTPWTPYLTNWAFTMPKSKNARYEVWSKIPEDTDILITHTPPRNILDHPTGRPDVRLGCSQLLKRVEELPNIKYHFFGHIHASRGQEGRYVNASSTPGRSVRPRTLLPPMEFEV